jgi:cytochrome c nitrite reductase small subunit
MKRDVVVSWTVGALVGLSAGVGVYTFVYAKGASYFGHEPSTCANCHVMQEQFDGWIRSSHRAVAVCNDCHAPHSLLPKFAIKGINGFRHSLAFTLGGFHEPIRITSLNRSVTEAACRHCHEDAVANMIALPGGHGGAKGDVSCIRCHGSVGHPTGSGMVLRVEESTP